MPSEKLTRILKAKSPLTAEQIEAMTEAEGWNWVYSHASRRKEKLPSICFTGFSQTHKDELSSLATGARFRVVTAVNSSLSFLCAGDNAGPVKLAKAKDNGISIMNRAEFLNFLETGEIPIP
jgi:NAD-dependent DNA ligase